MVKKQPSSTLLTSDMTRTMLISSFLTIHDRRPPLLVSSPEVRRQSNFMMALGPIIIGDVNSMVWKD